MEKLSFDCPETVPEVVGVGLLGGLELVVVEEGVLVGHTQEQPGKA
jgi:hypothetical protein